MKQRKDKRTAQRRGRRVAWLGAEWRDLAHWDMAAAVSGRWATARLLDGDSARRSLGQGLGMLVLQRWLTEGQGEK